MTSLSPLDQEFNSTPSIPPDIFSSDGCKDQFIGLENFTMFKFPGEIIQTHYGLEQYMKIGLYVVAILTSLIGNLAVVVSVALTRTLRVTVNLYLANLAVADILICICCMWVHLVNHLTAPAFVLGPFFCKMNSFAQMTCLTSSVLTLSAISCDRYIAIMYPLRSRVTKSRTGIVITAIWILSFGISIPFFLSRRYTTINWIDYTQTLCLEDWPYTIIYSPELQMCVKRQFWRTFYYTLVSSTLFFFPVIIMISAYSAIIWKLWGSKLPGEANYANAQYQRKSKRKVIQMVVVVLLVFVICWLPLQVILLYSIYFHSALDSLPSWFPNLSFYSYFVAYLNSVFNPLIYGGFNKNFRDALCKHIFCTSLCWGQSRQFKRPQPSVRSYSTTVTSLAVRDSQRNGTHFRTSLASLAPSRQVGCARTLLHPSSSLGESRTEVYELESFSSDRASFL